MCGQLGAQLALPLLAVEALPRWLGAQGVFCRGEILLLGFDTEVWAEPSEEPLPKHGTGLVARRLQINENHLGRPKTEPPGRNTQRGHFMLKQDRVVQWSGALQVFVDESNDSALLFDLHATDEGIAGKRPKVPCQLPSQFALALVELIVPCDDPPQFRAGMYGLGLSEMGKPLQSLFRSSVQMSIFSLRISPESGPQNGFLLGRGQLHQPVLQEPKTLRQGQSFWRYPCMPHQRVRHLARVHQVLAMQKEILHGLAARLGRQRLEESSVFIGSFLGGRLKRRQRGDDASVNS